MNRFFYLAKAILLGLLTTQVLATLHVYLSNADLYRTVTIIAEAGYLAIPNQQVILTLKEFGPAFFGGWFFTLSLGAGLSVFSVACAWGWDRIFGRSKALLIPIGLLWLGPAIAVNSHGFCPVVSSHFLFTPLVVFFCTLKWMPKQSKRKRWFNKMIHFLPIALLTIIWTAHADRFLFLDLRDYLLLSNPVGKRVDDFYYRYTLYPAEVFKSLEQKTLKTCYFTAIKDKAVARRVEAVLINHDYLPVANKTPVDLEIVQSANAFIFKHQGKSVLQTPIKAFFSQPEDVLSKFSAAADRHALFRQATIVCLLVGFPITLYVMVFALLYFVLRFFLDPTPSSLVAGALCFLIGLVLLLPLRLGRVSINDNMPLSEALTSKSWQQRVAALRRVVSERQDIAGFPDYPRMLESPHIPERYWLVKALGVSRHPETYPDLLALLDDPHANVVSMAFYALGQRGDRQAIKEILTRIETSKHWYNQWYAYRALRRLGWKQSRPKNVLVDVEP
ncbi:MAG: HEAT repeat domain-containing protein [Deltaproteobacteria bacterium]|jgi:hypothetical protein